MSTGDSGSGATGTGRAWSRTQEERLGEDKITFPRYLQGCPAAEGKDQVTEARAGLGGEAEQK